MIVPQGQYGPASLAVKSPRTCQGRKKELQLVARSAS
jgi:hypothetical protein